MDDEDELDDEIASWRVGVGGTTPSLSTPSTAMHRQLSHGGIAKAPAGPDRVAALDDEEEENEDLVNTWNLGIRAVQDEAAALRASSPAKPVLGAGTGVVAADGDEDEDEEMVNTWNLGIRASQKEAEVRAAPVAVPSNTEASTAKPVPGAGRAFHEDEDEDEDLVNTWNLGIRAARDEAAAAAAPPPVALERQVSAAKRARDVADAAALDDDDEDEELVNKWSLGIRAAQDGGAAAAAAPAAVPLTREASAPKRARDADVDAGDDTDDELLDGITDWRIGVAAANPHEPEAPSQPRPERPAPSRSSAEQSALNAEPSCTTGATDASAIDASARPPKASTAARGSSAAGGGRGAGGSSAPGDRANGSSSRGGSAGRGSSGGGGRGRGRGASRPALPARRFHGVYPVRARAGQVHFDVRLVARGRAFRCGTFVGEERAALVYDAYARSLDMPTNFAAPPSVGSNQELVGRRVSVYWRRERKYFEGQLSAIDAQDGTFEIAYDDGDWDKGVDVSVPDVVLLPRDEDRPVPLSESAPKWPLIAGDSGEVQPGTEPPDHEGAACP